MLFATIALFSFIGLHIPFFYVQLYSARRMTVDPRLEFYLLPLLNAGGFGRTVGILSSCHY